MTRQRVQTLLEDDGFVTSLWGEAESGSVITYGISPDGNVVPLYITRADDGMWRFASFPHRVKKKRRAEELLELYAALGLIPLFADAGGAWDVGAATLVADDEAGFARKARGFLAKVMALNTYAAGGKI